MLYHLSISNYALIDAADIEFDKGFTVITGETGAGKSIMLGALSLILGQRADSLVIRDKDKKCVVEAGFNIEGYDLQPLFNSEDVDYDNSTVVRREILPGGKSRAFVNDTPVTLSFLKALSDRLLDIHSQHQNLLLGDYKYQLTVVDSVANNEAKRVSYSSEYNNYKRLLKERAGLIEMNEKQRADRDYWEFQHKQLKDAALREDEQADLERELEQLSHIEEVKTSLSLADTLLSSGETPVVDQIHIIYSETEKVGRFLEEGRDLVGRLKSLYIELKDIARSEEHTS